MKWEVSRHDWGSFGDHRLGGWIEELVSTEDAARANDLMWMIEAEVVPPNGPMKPGAAAVAACLVQGLLVATATARIEFLYLLFQLAGGAAGDPGASEVRREVQAGLPIVAEIAESGSHAERMQCIDFLAMYGQLDDFSRARARYLLGRIAEVGQVEAGAVAVELAELDIV